MKRITLTFSEQEEAAAALNGMAITCGLQDYDNYLRAKLKYEDLDDATYKAYDDARKQLLIDVGEFLHDLGPIKPFRMTRPFIRMVRLVQRLLSPPRSIYE